MGARIVPVVGIEYAHARVLRFDPILVGQVIPREPESSFPAHDAIFDALPDILPAGGDNFQFPSSEPRPIKAAVLPDPDFFRPL